MCAHYESGMNRRIDGPAPMRRRGRGPHRGIVESIVESIVVSVNIAPAKQVWEANPVRVERRAGTGIVFV